MIRSVIYVMNRAGEICAEIEQKSGPHQFEIAPPKKQPPADEVGGWLRLW